MDEVDIVSGHHAIDNVEDVLVVEFSVCGEYSVVKLAAF